MFYSLNSSTRRAGVLFATFVVLLLVAICALIAHLDSNSGPDKVASARPTLADLPGPYRDAHLTAAKPHSKFDAIARKHELKQKRYLESPAAVAERKRSQTAYRDISSKQAVAVAREQQPAVAKTPAWQAPPLKDGEKIASYPGASTAIVKLSADERSDAHGAKSMLVQSTSGPIAAKDSSGGFSAQDLKLDTSSKSGSWEPSLASVPSSIPSTLGDPVTLSDANNQPAVGVRVVGNRASGRRITDSKVFYANSGVDTDAVVEPVPTGVSVNWLLRSPKADRTQHLAFTLGSGQKLRVLEDRSAAIVDGDTVVATIQAPSAWDAQHRPIGVSYSVEGDTLNVSLDRGTGELAYPLAIDPVIGLPYANAPNAVVDVGASSQDPQWGMTTPVFNTSSSNVNRIKGYTSTYNGLNTLNVTTMTNGGGTAYANWWYDPIRTSSVVRIWWQNVRKPATGVALQTGIINMSGGWMGSQWGGYYNGGTGAYIGGANSQFGNASPYTIPTSSPITVENCSRTAAEACAATGPSNTGAYYELATDSGTAAGKWADTLGAFVYVSDNDSPTLTRNTALPSTTSKWVDQASFAPSYTATDAGLGLGNMNVGAGHLGSALMWNDNGAGYSAINSLGPVCDGGYASPCSASDTETLPAFGQGKHVVSVKSSDIIGHESTPDNFTVKLDNEAPEIDLSGRLGAYALDTATLGAATPRSIVSNAPFVITAHDGSTTTDSMRRSGVKTLSAQLNKSNADGSEDTTSAPVVNYDVNGAPKQSPASCDENNGGTTNSCSLSYGGTFNTDSLTPGIYYFHVTATDYLGHVATKIFKLGVGVADVTGVSEGQATARYVPLSVVRKRGTATAFRLQYRSSENSTWCDVPASSVQSASDATRLTSWPQNLSGDTSQQLVLDLSALTVTTGGCSGSQLLPDGELRVRALMEGSGADFTRASEDVTVLYDHGGKDTNDDTEAVGPGRVDMVTGNFSLSATDASVDAFQTDLTVGRAYNSRYSGTDSLLGPGWSLNLPSSGEGSIFTEVTDNADVTLPDDQRYPSVDVAANDGTVIEFELSSTPNADGSDRYVPETGLEGLKLTRIPDSYDPARTAGFTLTDLDTGRVVGFRKPKSDDSSQAGKWLATDVSDPSQPNEITYQYSADTPRRLLNAFSATGNSGVTCGTDWTAIPRGCQALHFDYTKAKPNLPMRLSTVSLRTFDPSASAMTTVAVAQYQYDSSSRLIAEWDPRISPSLKTQYGYTTSGTQQLLTSVTPPGESPHTFSYSKLTEDSSDGRLATSSRTTPDLGVATQSMRYFIPTTTATASSAPFDMTASNVAAWGQPAPPWSASAIFSPDTPPNGTPATNYDRATVSYLDPLGQEVNTLSPGGRLNEVEYDKFGNVTRSLTAENRSRAMALSTAADRLDASKRWDTENTYAPVPGSLQGRVHLVRTTDPEHQMRLDDNSWVQGRTVIDNTYDEGSPRIGDATKEPFDLVTTTKESALVGSTLRDTRTKTVSYGSTDAEWSFRIPRTTTTDPGGLSIQSKSTIDSQGLETERFQPRSQSSAEPSTTKFVYWTAGANASDSACGNRPEWMGLPCKVGPGAQPTTSGLAKLPVKTITYNYLREPSVITESVVDASGAAKTRTTTKTYDAAGRLLTRAIAGDLGTAVKTTSHEYDVNTGRETATRSLNADGSVAKSITRTFDSIGRRTNYVDAEGHSSSTVYDIDSRPATVNDGKATRTNTYDPVTGDLVFVADSGAGNFTGTYDADGRLIGESLPGGLGRSFQYDAAGTAFYTAYTRVTGCSSSCMLYDEYAVENAHGQFNGLWDDTQGRNSTTQLYDFDAAGRLTRVQDWRDDSGTSRCAWRQYSYDADSNRTQKIDRPENGTSCPTSGGTVQNNSYDAADRLTNSGYAYDAFGRITTVPAADTGATGDLTASYYVNDLARSITQNATTQTLDLDPALRLSVKTKTTGQSSSTESYAYTDDSDSPAWTQTGTSWSRNVDGISGVDAVQDSANGTALLIEDLRGDVVAQSSTLGTLSNFTTVDEFGVPKAALPAGTKYAFHGSQQRETLTTGGVVAMGARLYQPQEGRFLQVDPELGGTANPYEYPSDPVNSADLDGNSFSCSTGIQAWPPAVKGQCTFRKAFNRAGTKKIINVLQSAIDGGSPTAMVVCGALGLAAGVPGAICSVVAGALLASAYYYKEMFRKMLKKSHWRGTIFKVQVKVKAGLDNAFSPHVNVFPCYACKNPKKKRR